MHKERPRWPAPGNVHAFTTTRAGGVSQGAHRSLNLGFGCGDAPEAVTENRRRLRAELPSEPAWVRQVHGTGVVTAGKSAGDLPEADALVCRTPGVPCAILTADCLPVLFCDRAGERIAVAHAGWRGLAAGVLEATLDALGAEPDQVLAWMGPGIGRDAFEIGEEVRAAFLGVYPDVAHAFHRPGKRWHADLYAIARHALIARGVAWVGGGALCTYTDSERFYSHRRDGQSGRMATVIWMTGNGGASRTPAARSG